MVDQLIRFWRDRTPKLSQAATRWLLLGSQELGRLNAGRRCHLQMRNLAVSDRRQLTVIELGIVLWVTSVAGMRLSGGL